MSQTNPNHSISNALLAILNSAKDAGVLSLTKTELVKYLYLLDFYVAEETSGKKLTDVLWEFFHYGPYSTEVINSIDQLVVKSWIKEIPKQKADKEFLLYSLENRGDFSLISSDIPSNAMMKLNQAIRNFKGDLYKLLNYVYFKTDPMAVAVPGSILDFSMCRKFDITTVKPIPMKPLNQARVNELRSKRRLAITKKQSMLNELKFKGPFDEAYDQAMSSSDVSQLVPDITGRARIGF